MSSQLKVVGNYLTVNDSAVAVVGSSLEMYGNVVPTGYLACDGSEISKTLYSKLYAVLGDIYATTGGVAAPAVGNFRLPPSEVGGLGLYNRGVGATNGIVGTYQVDVFKSHTHLSGKPTTGQGTSGTSYYRVTANQLTTATGDATETRPRSLTVLKCICTGVI